MGGTYQKPLATMRTYLEKMAAVPEAIEPGAGRPVRLLAALGPKMIELSGTHADGAHPYLVLPEQTRVTREHPRSRQVDRLRAGRHDRRHRRRTNSQWAHGHLNVYSGLPNYRNSWLRQGFDESDLVPGAPTGWPRALVGMGSVEQAAAALRAHLDAGADHVVLQVIGDNPMADPRPALRELAAALELG